MKKFMYEKLLNEYSKETKEKLINRIMAGDSIECHDREFANCIFAGTTAANINNLFEAIDDLEKGFTYEKAAKLYEITMDAKISWNYILSSLEDMQDPQRSDKALKDFEESLKHMD